jgi:membrane protease YdiL (CAAX protease family)
MNGEIRKPSLFADTWRAHALWFERPLDPQYGAAVGARMLQAFLVFGIGVFLGLRYALRAWSVGDSLTRLVFVATLLVVFFAAQRSFVRASLSDVGLRRWSEWTRRERLYLVQVVPLAAVAFSIVFRTHLRTLLELHGPTGFAIFSVLTGIAWGMVQEFIYRGWLQTELRRRLGAVTGVLLANVVFTLGPLHFDHLTASGGVHWGTLAAVFVIGLFFGVLYQRSGNLWIPALLHGLWPLNMS